VLEQIVVDEAVRRLRPDFAVLAVVARGVRGGPSDDASRAPAGLPEINRLVDAYNAPASDPVGPAGLAG
jgi:hypothetical protein